MTLRLFQDGIPPVYFWMRLTVPSIIPCSGFSAPQRATSFNKQADLRIVVETLLLGQSSQASHSSHTLRAVKFPDKSAGPSHGVSFGAPAEDEMSIAASEGGLKSSWDEESVGEWFQVELDPEFQCFPGPLRVSGLSETLHPALNVAVGRLVWPRVGPLRSTSLPLRMCICSSTDATGTEFGVLASAAQPISFAHSDDQTWLCNSIRLAPPRISAILFPSLANKDPLSHVWRLRSCWRRMQ